MCTYSSQNQHITRYEVRTVTGLKQKLINKSRFKLFIQTVSCLNSTGPNRYNL